MISSDSDFRRGNRMERRNSFSHYDDHRPRIRVEGFPRHQMRPNDTLRSRTTKGDPVFLLNENMDGKYDSYTTRSTNVSQTQTAHTF